MVEVAGHLAPEDGVSDVQVRFEALLVDDDGAGTARFAFADRGGKRLGYVEVPAPSSDRGISGAVADAHRELIDAFRQAIYRLDVLARAYDRQVAG
jgi:hypothetical protein